MGEDPKPLFLNSMQGKKALFLFLALLLPVGIFVFLKFFGKNEFDVPALYEDKAPVVDADCGVTYSTGYTLADSVMTQLSAQNQNEVYLIHFSDLSSRMKQEIRDTEVTFVDGNVFSNADTFRRCILVVPSGEDLILVDKLGKLRGYYRSEDREEVDRLLLELKIILKKY